MAKLILVADQRIVASLTPADFLLYVRQATTLLAGEWLGPHDVRVLAKGIGYPLFLVAVTKLHVPVLLAQQLVYCLAVLLIIFGLQLAQVRRIAIVCAATFLLFSPDSYSIANVILSRNPLYASTSLLLLALLFLALFVFRWRILIPLVVFFALIVAWYSIIREEFVWILPIFGLFLGLYSLKYRHKNVIASGGRLALMVVISAVSITAVKEIIRYQNLSVYGINVLYDQAEGGFPKAIAALSRIETGQHRHFVPINEQARLLAYDASPSFRTLKRYLEGPARKTWTKFGCQRVGVCDDIAGGWFTWAVKNAATAAGYYQTPATSEAFYQKMADEINAACESGKLPCTSQRNSLRAAYFRRAEFAYWPKGFAQLMVMTMLGDVNIQAGPSNPRTIKEFEDIFPGQVDIPAFRDFDLEAALATVKSQEALLAKLPDDLVEQYIPPQNTPNQTIRNLLKPIYGLLKPALGIIGMLIIGHYLYFAWQTKSLLFDTHLPYICAGLALCAVFASTGLLTFVHISHHNLNDTKLLTSYTMYSLFCALTIVLLFDYVVAMNESMLKGAQQNTPEKRDGANEINHSDSLL
ncbi:MAG: hypothetical protein KDJ52_04000 [Anaerolineae bacterium]|nr:hypothetical protein [Anaerolineae bacterium]